MPLKPCIKATKNLHDDDISAILESYDSYAETMDNKAAAEHAIDDAIESVKSEKKEYVDLFNETYPDALKAAGQNSDLTDKPVEKKEPKKKVEMPFKPQAETKEAKEKAQKEDDSGVTFSKEGKEFNQSSDQIDSKPKQSIGVDRLNQLVNKMKQDAPGTRLVNFHVRETQADAFGPDSVKEYGIIKGGFYSETDEIVLVAENIVDISDAIKLIRHELVGHYGLRQLLNKDGKFDKLLKRVYDSRNGELKELYDWVEKTYPYHIRNNDIRAIADEMLSRAAETQTKSTILTEIYDFIIRILNKIGLVYDSISKKEVKSLIRSSSKNLRKGALASARNYKPTTAYRLDDGSSNQPPTLNQETNDAPTDGNLGMPDEKMKDKFVRIAQDNFNRIKKLQSLDEIKVTPESDIYLAEERHTGIIKEGLDVIDNEYQSKLIKVMKDNNLTLDVLDSYAIAKHAEERNNYVDSINPEPHSPGSGITTEHANEIIEELEANYTGLEEAMNIVYDLNNKTLETLVSSGLMKAEVASNLKDRWTKYVPLKVKQDVESRAGTGSGFSIGGSGIKQAFGHGKDNITESPVTHSFAQAQAVVVRAEKTKIGQALVKLVRDNPDSNFWTISQRTYSQFETLFGEPFEGYDQEPKDLIHELDYTKVLSITAEEKKLAKAEGRPPKPVTAYRLTPESRNRDDIFSVMVKGEELLIKIKDPVIMRQLKRMNVSELNRLVRYAGAVNRYLALVFTGANPEFLFTNFERDFLASMVTLSGEHSVATAAKVAKGIPAAIKGITQSTFNQKGTSEMRTAYEEMAKQGGTIGFFGLDSIDSQIKNIERKLKGNEGLYNKSKSAVFGVRDFVLDANLSMENAARLSSYVVMRNQLIANGMSRDHAMKKAASVAKNLTVNFNRKGEWAPVFNSIWLFSSVGIQGSARIVAALKHKRIQKIVAGMAAMGYFMALYSQAMGGDDDDGIPKWDKITDYEKQTSIILMHPDGSGEYTTYKLPYGWSVFYYAGIQMYDGINVKTQSAAKTSMNMLSALLNSYNPIQGADFLDTVTPTILKPIEQAGRNKNYAGRNIYPEFKYDNFDRPESQKAFKGTNQVLKDLLSDLNEVGFASGDLKGGDESHSGPIDISPEIIKHYTKWITGGAGMFIYRTGDVATKLATGQDVEARDIPIARLFATKSPSAAFDSERYYKAVKEVNAVERQIKLLKGTDRYQDYKSDNSEVHKLAFKLRTNSKKVKRLRDARDKAYLEDDRDLALEKTEEIRQNMMKFSLLYDDAIEAQQ